MANPSVAALLERLRSADSRSAWKDFLRDYNAVLYQTARACNRDEDDAADSFVYICEQLARNSFRRLLRFQPEGDASFNTWLQVVARNLCTDWHRRKYGRARPFKVVQALSDVELEVYRCLHERGFSQEKTLEHIRTTSPSVSLHDLNEIESRVQSFLSSRHHWILSTRQRVELTTTPAIEEDGEQDLPQLIDGRPNQEVILLDQQLQTTLQKCISSLPADERLIVRLRFEEGLSLREIARLTGLGDAHRVHRCLAVIIQKLRTRMRAAIGQSNLRKTAAHVRALRQETK